ncbi:MAG: FAD-dependent oxidoreductase [Planctomycetaceae bacterium]|nr:FAD-dependent oxidoreductase [Planctomycetaceae bacterium]
MRTYDTVIVGGGIAGLACARQLRAAGHDFFLVTDRLGGRMFANGAAMHNFGATYVTSDYRHIGRFIDRGRRVRWRDVFFHDGVRFLTIWHPSNLRHRRALLRLYARLIEFRGHLNRLRALSPRVCQAELLRDDPLLGRATREPAAEFVARNGLADLNATFVAPMVNSTVFTTFEQVNTFYYLAVLMPILLPTYLADFSRTIPRLTAGLCDRIGVERVVALETSPRGGFAVTTTLRDLRARNVVVATPAHNLRDFGTGLDPSWIGTDGVREIPIVTLHVRGRRRDEYRPEKLVFLRPDEAATVLIPLEPGLDMLFAPTPEPDLAPYFEHHEVAARVRWKTAIQLSGACWRRLAPRPGLYTIGDYNICGLEDSYLTGLFAANRIVG